MLNDASAPINLSTVMMSTPIRIHSMLCSSESQDLDVNSIPTLGRVTPKPREAKPLSPSGTLFKSHLPIGRACSETEPSNTELPEVAIVGEPRNGVYRREGVRPPMRSNIACTRCRKSKIKCENTKGSGPCHNCDKAGKGKDCVFESPSPVRSKRAEPPKLHAQEQDTKPVRKRPKIDDVSTNGGQSTAVLVEAALSASFLTEDLWEQVFDLYKLHFAPELSFLHLPTMKEELGQRKSQTPRQNSESSISFLGVLTLTARFHPGLVNYTAQMYNNESGSAKTCPDQNPPDTAIASEYYADILAKALQPTRENMSAVSVDRVGALLMLGHYEWSRAQSKPGGIAAWTYVGHAIRMAQILKLGDEKTQENGDATFPPNLRLNSVDHKSQLTVQREIRRRLMFSCFILDRMLICGNHGMWTIQEKDLHIQLPCSEFRFDLDMEVHTRRLSQLEHSGDDDNILSRFIQLVNLWGKIAHYIHHGGCAKDEHPPWHRDSSFFCLITALKTFDFLLPSSDTFSNFNYLKHENHQASSVFVLLHMLRFVCIILLHREHLPFTPLRCQKPEALHQPIFTEEAPAGFWRTSAEQLFKASRGIIDLIMICQKSDKLPQSAIVIFAVWNAGLVGLYSAHFPQIDTERHMLSFDSRNLQEDNLEDIFKHGPAALALQTLMKMSTWSKMASKFMGALRHVNNYLDAIKLGYRRDSKKERLSDRPTSRFREGGTDSVGFEETSAGNLRDFVSLQSDGQDTENLSEQPQLESSVSFTRTYPTPGSVLIPSAVHASACESSMEDTEHFFKNLERDQVRRSGAGGDLSLFSAGESEP